MAKSPPEKLAAALRANLKRRKQGPQDLKGVKDGRAAGPGPDGPRPESPPKPPKNSA
jgi:hypothetical protein